MSAPRETFRADDAESPAALVKRIVARDAGAEAELLHRYGRAVTALMERNTPRHTDTDDLFQETFFIVIQKIRNGEVREPERLSGFVCSVARNVAIAHARRIDPSSRRDVSADSAPTSGPSQLDEVLRKENALLVRRVLQGLASGRDRELLGRFYLAEESKESICQAMRLSSLQFDQVLFRARQRYRALYSKEIVEGR